MGSSWRVNFLLGGFVLASFLVGARLFYWQILTSEKLKAAAESQHWISFEIPAQRGKILASDGFPLASNKDAYLLFASLPDLKSPPEKIAAQVAPILVAEQPQPATGSAQKNLLETEEMIKTRLRREDLVWVPLAHKLSQEAKTDLEKLALAGLGFKKEPKRAYPESSSAAHLLGFVGADLHGQDKGYFGLEGEYDLELRGQPGLLRREKDASGKPILVGDTRGEKEKNGRDLVTTINRAVQFAIEKKLKEGLGRYGAVSGSVVVMEPKTGAILAMSSLPAYDPAEFGIFDKAFYPNPVVASSFEPGSIFKVVVLSAALNEKVVFPETRCELCAGPRRFAEYTIKTWNDEYHPDSSVLEIIEHSDNVGMVFIGEKLGTQKLVAYLRKFGFGQETGIDLEDENSPLLRPEKEWGLVDLATASFGQGVAVTPIQMVRAVGAIANQGKLMRPFVVKKVIGDQGASEIMPKMENQVVSSATAKVMTEIMVNAVTNGEAKWAKPKGYRIAGKTGTAQIPVAGHYDEEKTIASFVGFAPADNPKFVMLVTLREPTSSPWGSETAAPLWFDIAQELFTYFSILPE